MRRRDLARPRRRAIVLAFALVIGAVMTGACSKSAPGRPTTDATLEITAPAPNSVTGPNVEVRVHLAHAKVVAPTDNGGAIRGDRGHIHISVDGALVSMVFQLEQPVTGLAPGTHTIQAEFVASDHLPFKNRVVAAVTFRVS